jgi:serine/threonine protein kinase
LLTAGSQLGPYQIQSPLGAGGMGEVYRARDSRLGRDVAIKVLPESFARDAEHMRRFEQEARAIAALSHPNVVAVFDVGTHEGAPYLVSELLEGESLRERLKAGPIGARKAVEYAQQMAEGLAAAHDKGIVHRDLKPDNVFLTSGGRVKLIDFGLAKLERPDANAAATMTAGQVNTAAGVVMGTAAYMSPEQVRGLTVDYRSDLFSFGAVLYEMLTGNRAFTGQSSIETMNAILKDEPPEIDISRLKVTPGMERIIRHCLEKNPADRFQSARDLGFALSALSGSEATAAVRTTALRRQPWRAWAAAALLLIIAVAWGWMRGRQGSSGERLEFAIPTKGEVSYLAISPDGRMLALVSPEENSGTNMLSVQHVGSADATVLPGTEGATYPFWSPDDTYVAFFADGRLKKIASSGGIAQILASASSGRGGTWGSRGVIVYAPEAGGPLWRIDADGRDTAPLTAKFFAPEESSHRWPFFLPDGEHFLFWAGQFTNAPDDRTSGIYLSSLTGGEKKLLLPARSNPAFAQGYLFYMSEPQTLTAVPVDTSKVRVLGEPRAAGAGVSFQPSTFWGSFAVSENGTLVYNTAARGTLSALTWYDRTGRELGRVGEVGTLANPQISPDGNHVAMDVTDVRANNVDVWISDLQKGTNSRFTFNPAEEVAGTWSRDGKTIVFRSATAGATLFSEKVMGLEPPKSLLKNKLGADDMITNSWSLDDQQILCSLQPSSGGSDLVLVSVRTGDIAPFLATKASETNGQISPDGKWVAYASDESGDWEIYVTTFPGAAGKWQVSRGGGTEPRWRGDGKEIFYLGPKGMLTAVPVSSEGTFSTGTPTPLFQIHARAPISSTDLYSYDVSKDGKRFLVNRYVKPEYVAPLNVVLNATAEPEK